MPTKDETSGVTDPAIEAISDITEVRTDISWGSSVPSCGMMAPSVDTRDAMLSVGINPVGMMPAKTEAKSEL